MDRETIAAIATPLGRGGIGIVKISGSHARNVARKLFKPRKQNATQSGDKLNSHHLYYGWIVDPHSGETIDEVLVAFMQAPHTYTCEDILEIHAHSGIAVLSRILSLVLAQNVRLAHPGEFTQRAFLNGRIDLSQAESVIDTIDSTSQQALQMAMAQMNGRMRSEIDAIRQELIDCLVQIETAIDFIEDPDDIIVDQDLPQRIRNNVVRSLKTLIIQYQRAHLFRDGIKMAVVGKPNVGKSSLMNWLIKKDRAIVTDIPGTTRDLIEESVTIRGIPIVVVDTAGLREDGDSIEKIGIQKTHAYIDQADLVLFMVDASTSPDKNDHRIFNQIKHQNVVIVYNKIDLMSDDRQVSLPLKWQQRPAVTVSALKQTGMERLEKMIQQSVNQSSSALDENPLVPNLRQKEAIERAKTAAQRLVDGLKANAPLEVAAIDANEAINALGEITGETIQDTIIDQIFNRFCIGK